MKALMGKMNKLSTKMISRHDVLSLKGNEIKRFTRQALSHPNESVVENLDNDEDDDVVNHRKKSRTYQNPLYKTRPMREFGGRFQPREEF
jgi:hypothetical protein